MTKANKVFALTAVALMMLMPMAIFIEEASAANIWTTNISYDGVKDRDYGVDEILTIKNPEKRTGYEFQYWSLSNSTYHPGDKVNVYKLVIKTSSFKQDFTSVWKALEYDITFADGDLILESRHVKYGAPHGDLPEVSKPGYTLVGWTADGTEAGLLDDKVYNIPYNCTLTPLWKPNSYNAYLVDDGKVYDTVKCDFGKAFPELPNVSRPGYLFMGWSLNAEGTMIVDRNTVYETVGDSTLYAVWTAKTFNVTLFDGGVEYGSVQVKYNDTYGTLPELKKTGMTFMGWSTDGTISGLVSKDTKYTTLGDTKLYAVWKANEYLATFDSHGGSLSFESKTFQYGSSLGEFPTCEKSGYKLKGWSLTADGTSMITANTPLMQDGNITVHAIWENHDATPTDWWIGINLDNPVTLISLTLLIAGTIAVCLFIYRKGLL